MSQEMGRWTAKAMSVPRNRRQERTIASPPVRGILASLGGAVGSAPFRRTLERTIERSHHTPLGEIERGGLPIARTRQVGDDLFLQASRMRPHHDDAIRQYDRFLDVVGND